MSSSVNVRWCTDWLKDRAANQYSQFGEDGLIAAVFARIGIANRWCFEVGANDGIFYSNTKALRDDRWSACLIEQDSKAFAKLNEFASQHIHIVNKCIGVDDIDHILASCRAPVDLDFGVIDIDGQDYWAWQGMKVYAPRVMLVEFDVSGKGPPKIDTAPGTGRGNQAGRDAIVELGESKGYAEVAATHVNSLFVKRDALKGVL